MAKFISLDALTERSVYVAYFMDMAIWEPYVRLVCQRHGWLYKGMKPAVPGSFPTFIVETGGESAQKSAGTLVIKFFGPLFNGEASFSTESYLGHWLQQQSLLIHSPSIRAGSQLEPGWRYLILEYVQGDQLI